MNLLDGELQDPKYIKKPPYLVIQMIGTFIQHPLKKGIYAFPKGYVETFLLGVSPENMIPGKRPNGRFFYLRDENGNKINREQYYDENYNPKPWISKLLKKED